MILVTAENIYKVTYESLDDGHRLIDSYWSNEIKAGERAKKLNDGHVVPAKLLKEAGKYYEYEIKEVVVDPLTKEQVLSKLTSKERKALGL